MFKKPEEALPLEDTTHFLSDSKENKTDLTEAQRPSQPTAVVLEPSHSVFDCIADYAQITRELFHNCRQSQLPLISKQISPENYWFVVGALYFPELQPTDLNRLEALRREQVTKPLLRFGDQHTSQYSVKAFYDSEDDLFVLENRSLIARNRHQSDQQQIRHTVLEDLALLWEDELSRVQQSNEAMLDKLTQEIGEHKRQRQRLDELLQPTRYRQEFPDFQYVELEDQEIALSKQRHQQQLDNANRCLVCLGGPGPNKTSPLLHCDSCGVSTHSKCYPLEHNPNQFRCYTCVMDTPQEEAVCVMCCCRGGLLLPAAVRADNPLMRFRFEPEPTYTIEETTSSLVVRLRRISQPQAHPPDFNMLVHGVCFKWHTELFFDESLKMVSGFGTVRLGKFQSVCFICGTNEGACVDCVAHGCQRTFHPECARRSGVSMATVKKADRLVRQLHCQRHRQRKQYEVMEENRWKRINTLQRTYESIEKLYNTQPQHRQRRPKKPSPTVGMDRTSQRSRYCVCKQEYRGQSMIECEHCNEWYHFECVQVRDVDHFICEMCRALQQQLV